MAPLSNKRFRKWIERQKSGYGRDAYAKTYSRRDVLKATAIAAVSLPLAAGALYAVEGRVRIRIKSGVLYVSLNGTDVWKTDPKDFAGNPSCYLREAEERTEFGLTKARFPGTSIPASFSCSLNHREPGCPAIISHDAGITADVKLSHWLRGKYLPEAELKRSLRFRKSTHGFSMQIPAGSRMRLKDPCSLVFNPVHKGTCSSGTDLIRFGQAKLTVSAPSVESLLPENGKRSSIRLSSGQVRLGAHEFSDAPAVYKIPEQYELIEATAELRELRADKIRSAFGVHLAPTGDHKLAVYASSGSSSALLTAGIRNLFVGRTHGNRSAESRIIATASEESPKLYHRKISADLKAGTTESIIEMDVAGSTLNSFRFKTGLDAVFLSENESQDKAIPFHGSDDSTYPVSLSNKPLSENQSTGILLPGKRTGDEPQIQNPVIKLIRPDDLVVLKFEFAGITLKFVEGEPKLVSNSSGGYMRVIHQPQSIAEQAFFQANDEIPVPEDDPDKNSGIEYLTRPPVKSFLSGKSRVVFEFPPDSRVAYTLSALLDAMTKWNMALTPNAATVPVRPMIRATILPGALGVTRVSFNLPDASPVVPENQAPLLPSTQPVSLSNVPVMGVLRPTDEDPPAPAVGVSDVQNLIRLRRNHTLLQTSVITRPDMLLSPGQLAPPPAVVPGRLLIPPSLPGENQTAVESPFRMLVSPHAQSAWIHLTRPGYSSFTDRTELWHSRLAVRLATGKIDERISYLKAIRAIWYTDYLTEGDKALYRSVPDHSNEPFRTSLNSSDRHQIVHLSSNPMMSRRDDNTRRIEPKAVRANQFILSSLGSFMNLKGEWDEWTRPSALNLESWEHVSTMARDHFVKVVYAGVLFPFGHAASMVKITEREFQDDEKSETRIAYLRQRMFIIIREPVVMHGLTETPDGRAMPFKSVEILNDVTPLLDNPTASDVADAGQDCFWPRVGGQDFRFNLILEDAEGNRQELTMPLAFVNESIVENQNHVLNQLIELFQEDTSPVYRLRQSQNLKRQQVALTASKGNSNNLFELGETRFSVNLTSQFPFWNPIITEFTVHSPALENMVGEGRARVRYFEEYLQHEYDSARNKAEIFLALIGGPEIPEVNFDGLGERIGGLIQPNFNISGFSRLSGAVGGALDELANGNFDPASFFSENMPDGSILRSFPAQLFGVLNLWDILDTFGIDEERLIPRFILEVTDKIERFLEDLERLRRLIAFLEEQEPVRIPPLQSVNWNQVKSLISALVQDILELAQAYLETRAQDLVSDLQSEAQERISELQTDVENRLNELFNIISDVREQIEAAIETAENVRRELLEAIERVQNYLDRGIDLAEAVQRFMNDVRRFAEAVQLAREMRVRFEWRPKLKSWPTQNPIFVDRFNFQGSDTIPATMVISTELNGSTTSGGVQAGFHAYSALEHFTINLAGSVSFVKLYFKKIAFDASSQSKPNVVVDFAGIEFAGPLRFIEVLRRLIPLRGFGDLANVDVLAEEIRSGFSLELPDVAMGMVSLQNIALNSDIRVPVIGRPASLGFNFCTRERPCSVTVLAVGGGAYFGISVNMRGLQAVEAAIEFGGSIAFNVVVASGSVTIMAGIYFRLEFQDDTNLVTLTGYLRFAGSVKVIGLITVCIEMRMDLSYVSSGSGAGKMVGRASISVRVKIAFFRKTVSISVERRFAGSNNDPSFEDQMGAKYLNPVTRNETKAWDEYCDAFAAI
ncbi:MAG: hypothetical protein LAT84_08945 [Balneolia bacterium]|nr:hypothetical protein [Balneolia bacterium]